MKISCPKLFEHTRIYLKKRFIVVLDGWILAFCMRLANVSFVQLKLHNLRPLFFLALFFNEDSFSRYLAVLSLKLSKDT